MNITVFDAEYARKMSNRSNSYNYVEDTYMSKIYDAILEGANKGYCVISINMFKLLKLKYWKYCSTLLTVVYDHFPKRGFTVDIKRNNIVIDWINPRYIEDSSEKEEEKEDKSEDSSTGAPRVLESDDEDEENMFTPKPLKMKI